MGNGKISKSAAADLSESPLAKKRRNLKWVFIVAAVGMFFLLLFGLVKAILNSAAPQGNIALISISGEIGAGDGLLVRPANPDDVVGMIGSAEKDSRVKGILVEVNSPGGSPVASEEVMKALKSARKPKAVVIRDIGASGAYWVASAADYVVASPVSLTGSIGVTASYLEFSQLLQKYGVGYTRLVSGENKDTGSPYRNITEEEAALMREEVGKLHEYFLNSVKENRRITDPAAIRKIATARVFLGSEAKELGLVDALGGKKEAEDWLMQQANLSEVKYITYGKKPLFSLTDLVAKQSAEAGGAFAQTFFAGLFSAASSQSVRT